MTGGKRALGLDLGERRIGVAISDELGAIASPLAMIPRGEGDLDEIARLAADHAVGAVVVGLPTGMSGREGPQAAVTRAFAGDLAARLGAAAPVRFWDERLTSAIADRVMLERGTKRDARKQQRDAIAAAVILQGWLDSQRSRRGGPG
ncbi:MAG: Holliday junction resolvase RuvX [Chloroflexota bacterium]